MMNGVVETIETIIVRDAKTGEPIRVRKEELEKHYNTNICWKCLLYFKGKKDLLKHKQMKHSY